MDTVGWVVRALEALRLASEKDLMRWLEEEGEAFSRAELRTALQQLQQMGRLEVHSEMYRLKTRSGNRAAFESLFNP